MEWKSFSFLNISWINLVQKYVQLRHLTQGRLILAVDFRMRDAPWSHNVGHLQCVWGKSLQLHNAFPPVPPRGWMQTWQNAINSILSINSCTPLIQISILNTVCYTFNMDLALRNLVLNQTIIDVFLSSRHPSAQNCIRTVRRSSLLVTVGIKRVKGSKLLLVASC